MIRHWQASWPGRWWTAFTAILRGVRVSPSAQLVGPRSQISLSRGVAISRGCVIRVDGSGQVALGERVWLARDCEIETASRVELGPRTTVQRRCTLNGTTRVGADCIFAPDVFVSSGTHPFREIAHLPIREQERRLAREGRSFDRPVWIQDDCWIGTHAVVAPGVTIGKGSVVGANSVVTRDVPPYSVVAGMPARVISQRLAWTPPSSVDLAAEPDRPYVLCAQAPLLVALRPARPGEAVRVHLRCESAAKLVVNGQEMAVEPHTQSITCEPATGLPSGATVEVFVPTGTVQFTRIELVEA